MIAAERGLLVTEHEETLLLKLDRPEARNAVDLGLAQAIAEAMDELNRRDDLRAAVIAGGPPVFCAGMDLKAFARGELPRVDGRGFAGLVQAPPAKPLIAAVDGPALGGGLEIVLACDLVVASPRASFGLPEVRRGLIASGGGVMRLRERLPYQRALEMVLTGNPMDATKAHSWGLVNRLVEPAQVLDEALSMAAQITANAPLAVRASKEVFCLSRDWPLGDQFARQEDVARRVRESADATEGARAFVERRKPLWSNR
jgi:enoyl-CoA hydratase